jgi:hypothetical protein
MQAVSPRDWKRGSDEGDHRTLRRAIHDQETAQFGSFLLPVDTQRVVGPDAHDGSGIQIDVVAGKLFDYDGNSRGLLGLRAAREYAEDDTEGLSRRGGNGDTLRSDSCTRGRSCAGPRLWPGRARGN